MWLWLNGELRDDLQQLSISATDRGRTLGLGVFETLRVQTGVALALAQHLERMQWGAAKLGLPPLNTAVVRAGVAAVLAAARRNPASRNGRLRITYTEAGLPERDKQGSSDLPGPDLPSLEANLSIELTKWEPPAESIAGIISPWRRNEHSPMTGVKGVAFAENVLARRHAERLGAQEAILANTAGWVAEGSSTNVFYSLGGQIVTPTLSSGALPGITRGLLLAHCDWIEVVDHPIDVLGFAEEMFVTSALRHIQPVHQLDDHRMPARGPMTQKVLQTWDEVVLPRLLLPEAGAD